MHLVEVVPCIVGYDLDDVALFCCDGTTMVTHDVLGFMKCTRELDRNDAVDHEEAIFFDVDVLVLNLLSNEVFVLAPLFETGSHYGLVW